jgi:hypothetical protein
MGLNDSDTGYSTRVFKYFFRILATTHDHDNGNDFSHGRSRGSGEETPELESILT